MEYHSSLPPADVLPTPALSSDFSQPLAYHCRICYDPPLGICISEKLEITLYHQHASKTFCLWPGKMPLQLLSSPVSWSGRERPSMLEMRVYASWGVQDSSGKCFSSMEEWRGKQKQEEELTCIMYFYYTFLKNRAMGTLWKRLTFFSTGIHT